MPPLRGWAEWGKGTRRRVPMGREVVLVTRGRTSLPVRGSRMAGRMVVRTEA